MNSIPIIHHVQVAMPAGGEEDARAFYGDVLGFSELEKPVSLQSMGGVWFRTGSIDLHIGVEQEFAPAKKAHVAYQVEHLTAVAKRVAEAGYPVTWDERLPGYNRFYTSDPFGNRVEVLTPVG